MELVTFSQGMALIQITFNLHPTPERFKAWYLLLQDIGAKAFEEAVMHLCRTGQKIFDNENVAALIRKIVDEQHLSAEEAWGKVLKKVASEGSWGTPKWEDESIAMAVESLGGWQYICSVENKDLAMMRAHFYRTFEACQKRVGLAETSKMIEASAEVKSLISGIARKIKPNTTS